jgi:hypothetical protein
MANRLLNYIGKSLLKHSSKGGHALLKGGRIIAILLDIKQTNRFKVLCNKMLRLLETLGTYLDLKAGGSYNLARLE